MKVFWKIIRESIKILIMASVISSIGGIGLEKISEKLVTLLPFLILIPAMNNMVGGFGIVMSSKINTMLYMGKLKEKGWWKSHEAGNLFVTVAFVAVISAVYMSLMAGSISLIEGFKLNAFFLFKLVAVTVITTLLLMVFMFWLSATVGFYIFKKNQDPANFLAPLTTSVADLGSMLIITFMVMLFF